MITKAPTSNSSNSVTVLVTSYSLTGPLTGKRNRFIPKIYLMTHIFNTHIRH